MMEKHQKIEKLRVALAKLKAANRKQVEALNKVREIGYKGDFWLNEPIKANNEAIKFCQTLIESIESGDP